MKLEAPSLATRLNAWFAAVVLGLSVLLFLAAYLLLFRAVEKGDREAVRAQLELCRAWYEQGGLPALSSRLLESDSGSQEIFFVRVIGTQGAALFVSLPKHAAGLDLSPLENLSHDEALAWLTLHSADHSSAWLAATAELPDGSTLEVGKTTEAQTALLTQFGRVFFWVALIALLLGGLGGAWLTRRALAPLRHLLAAMQKQIATGQLHARPPLPAVQDEIGRLARLFNTLLEKNDALIRAMREALDNVAHELRTPLTRLRGTAELALQGEPDAQKNREALLDAMEESDRVLTMLNTLMDISEAETGLMKLDRQPVVLAGLVAAVFELFEFVAEEKKITVHAAVPPDLECFVDPRRFRQVLVNLLDNALKYTDAGGRVNLTATRQGGEIVVTVQDSGRGIPAEEIPRIWERLYRGDKSRSQHGLGLGLSLVQAIVTAHGGRIELQSQPGVGSSFSIFLPADLAPTATRS